MRQQLDSDSRSELVYYRVKRAEETLSEADCLATNRHFSGALNRLYYACYYMVSALLLDNEIDATTHAGVKAMFALKFVKNGKLPMEHGKIFSEIFEQRHSNDYDDLIFCDEETYLNYRPRAESLMNAIKDQIYSNH